MDSLLMSFLNAEVPKSENSERAQNRIRDVVAPIRDFKNTKERLEEAIRKAKESEDEALIEHLSLLLMKLKF